MHCITPETRDALRVALNDVLNITQLTQERMRLFGLLKGVTPNERGSILHQIQGLRDRVADAELLLKLYVG